MAGISRNEEHAELQPSSILPGGDNLSPPPSRSNGPEMDTENLTATSPSGVPQNRVSYSPSSSQTALQVTSDMAKELLSHVAFMAEELLRASQEKVNLAQANHDSV